MAESFFQVLGNGTIMAYKRVPDKNGYVVASMMDCGQFDDWKIKEQVSFEDTFGVVQLSADNVEKLKDVFFSLSEAIPLSQERWEHVMAPRASYEVVRYFDHVEDGVIARGLTKREADEKATSMNMDKHRKYLTTYDIRKENATR